MSRNRRRLLVLNQMAGPLTWELVEDVARAVAPVALLTGHPDTLAKSVPESIELIPAAPYRRGSYVRRIGSWLRYLVQAARWILRQPPEDPLLLFSNPPLLPWLGWIMRRLRGQRYSVMVHDVYPDLLIGLGKMAHGNPIARLWRWLNNVAYRNAELVMTLGDYMARRLGEQFDPALTAAGRIHVIPPWADTTAIRPLPKHENWFAAEHGLTDKTCVMYSGNMGVGHDIETVLAAADDEAKDGPFRFMFIGAGPKWEWLAAELAGAPRSNVTLLGWQPEEVVPFSLAAADVAVVSLERGIEGVAIPSKAFSFLAAGSAILLLSRPQAELARIVESHDCGWVVTPGDLEGLSQVLREIEADAAALSRRRENSRAAAEKIGSRGNSGRIVDLLVRFGGIGPAANGGR